MKTYEEKTRDVFKRIEEEKKMRQKQRRTAYKIAVPVLSFCMAAAVGIGIWQAGPMRQPAIPAEQYEDAPVDCPVAIPEIAEPDVYVTDTLEACEENNESDSGIPDVIRTDDAVISFYEDFRTWNGCDSVSRGLYDALESANTDSVLAILARPAPDYTFVYENKTLAAYYSDMCDERNLPEILMQLLKEGDSLKYGDALYQTGTPDGEIWAQSWYEERTAFYGNDILEKYIAGGEFLAEVLEKDIETARNSTQASDAYNAALTEYLGQLAASVHGAMPSEAVTEKYGIVIYFTRDGFSGFINDTEDDIDTSGWTFDLYMNDGNVTYDGTITVGTAEDE